MIIVLIYFTFRKFGVIMYSYGKVMFFTETKIISIFQDEIINLVGSVPLTSIRSPSPVPTTDGGEEIKEEGDGDREESPKMKSPIIATPQEDIAVQEPETVPLVVPAALFRPTSYHPMHIFVSHVYL